MKLLLLILITIILVQAVIISKPIDNIKTFCNAINQNDTLLLNIKIINNNSENEDDHQFNGTIYFQLSNWNVIFRGVALHNLANSITFCASEPIDGEIIDDLKFIPKITYLEPGNSLSIKLKYYPNVSSKFCDSIYKRDIRIAISYADDDLMNYCEKLMNNKIIEDIDEVQDFSINLNEYIEEYNQKDKLEKYFTNVKLDECEVKILQLCFKKKIFDTLKIQNK